MRYIIVETKETATGVERGLSLALELGQNKDVSVDLWLMQDAVLISSKLLSKQFQGMDNVNIHVDDFSLTQRGVNRDLFESPFRIAGMDDLTDVMMQEDVKTIWH